jgi:homocitrate synthase NifV
VRADQLPVLAELVAVSARRPIPDGKCIVGSAAFTHESGIHVAGLLRDPETYEALRPERVGRTRRIVLGKHSGRTAVLHALNALGVSADAVSVALILEQIRARAEATKAPIGLRELFDLYVEVTRSPATQAAAAARAM